MKIERFEDIVGWKKAGEMTLKVYGEFSKCKDFGFKDQVQRAAVSVMNNIAEGYERRTNNEFKHYLYIAKGSCGEVRSMLYVAKKLNYINPEQYQELHALSTEISRILSGLIKKL
jgi:four helix bundle protein